MVPNLLHDSYYAIACSKLLVFSRLLNVEGVLAFMFCFTIKDKLNIILLWFFMIETIL
jgi:hypothetical protein